MVYMGSEFFKGKGKPSSITGGNQNLEARAMGASGYAARNSGSAAQKGIGVAQGINNAIIKAHAAPLKRSAAYPKGPKI
jgi:hypothetical protein